MSASVDSVACLDCRERLGFRRGLCERCYSRLGEAVRAGHVTWEELEQAGRARPAKRSPWSSKRT